MRIFYVSKEEKGFKKKKKYTPKQKLKLKRKLSKVEGEASYFLLQISHFYFVPPKNESETKKGKKRWKILIEFFKNFIS